MIMIDERSGELVVTLIDYDASSLCSSDTGYLKEKEKTATACKAFSAFDPFVSKANGWEKNKAEFIYDPNEFPTTTIFPECFLPDAASLGAIINKLLGHCEDNGKLLSKFEKLLYDNSAFVWQDMFTTATPPVWKDDLWAPRHPIAIWETLKPPPAMKGVTPPTTNCKPPAPYVAPATKKVVEEM